MMDDLKQRFAKEFAALQGIPFHIETDSVTAWAVMAHLQLALRHPENSGPTAQIVRKLVKNIIEVLTPPGTALREVAEKGWNPTYDE